MKNERRFFMKLKIICILVCFLISSCSIQKKPEGFPSKLTPFSVKLLKENKPIENASIALVADSIVYNIIAFTDSNGIANFKTSINTYSKNGVPPAAYNAIITHFSQSPSKISEEELGKMSIEESMAYNEKIAKEIEAMPKIVPPEWSNLKTTPI
jgi:hypothetical protein